MTETIFWTVFAVIGGLAAVYNIGNSFLDFRKANKLTNGRRLIARGRMFRDAIRLLIQLIYIRLGVLVLLGLPIPDFAWNMVTTAFLVVLLTVEDAYERWVLLQPVHDVDYELSREQQEDLEFGIHRRELEARHQKESNGAE